jgi:DNA-binding CsgD family transcriptional regulator
MFPSPADDVVCVNVPHERNHAMRNRVRGRSELLARTGRSSVAGPNAFGSTWWRPVKHFEHDGRRYVLAVENLPSGPEVDVLSDREREVVSRALLGQDNKGIAYDLGLSHATVRVLMARAAAKLAAGSRAELLEKAAHLGLAREAERGKHFA